MLNLQYEVILSTFILFATLWFSCLSAYCRPFWDACQSGSNLFYLCHFCDCWLRFCTVFVYSVLASNKRFDFFQHPNLTFEKPDTDTFKNLALAYKAMEKGGNAPCVLNAANEIAVEAFLNNKIGFLNMFDLIGNCLEKTNFVKNPSLNDLVESNNEARQIAKSML